MPAQLKSATQGETLILTLSNPEFRNALGPEIYAAGTEALIAAESNPDIKSVIITGEGEHFCAGGNLNRLLENRKREPQVQASSIEGLHGWIQAIRTFPKPVIAAVEGACAGAGFSLVLMCDMAVAASNSVIVLAYSNVGLSTDGGATWSLARALPRPLASEILMLGGKVSPQMLQQHGLLNQVCEPGQALAQALALAQRLNGRPGNVLASIKELLADGVTESMPTQLDAEKKHFVSNLHHANAETGIRAFFAKQSPKYL
ncbi:MAG: enoyl-CoA hydratase [Alphaproteobacteria bacterium]|nr:enoyl-CoA hydratase [Alphaproteobacteria bacterium]